MPPERSKIDRLPPWAKAYIAELEASTKQARAEADTLLAGKAPLGRVYVQRYNHGWRSGAKKGEPDAEPYIKIPLPEDESVVFVVGAKDDDRKNTIELKLSDEGYLEARGGGDFIGRLVVAPRDANSVSMRMERW